MTAIFVLTCTRGGADPWPYVGKTLAQIDPELDAPRVLFVDGAAPPPALVPPGWKVIEWQRPAHSLRGGNKLPYWALLDVAAGFDDALIFEDDLVFCRNAVRRMVAFPVPRDLTWVQFFSPHILPAGDMQPGLWRPPFGSGMFAQAIKFPRRGMEALLAWSQDREFVKFNGSDQALNLASNTLGLRYGVHAPDLVQHIGEISIPVPGQPMGGRVSQCWPGPDFDAMDLFSIDGRFR